MAKIAFKSDNQGQIQLLPPSLDESFVLFMNIPQLDIEKIFKCFSDFC